MWSVAVDLYVLNEDGNLMDACFLSTVLALMNTKLPEVMLSKDKIKINEERTKNLNVHHIPICISFYFIEGVLTPIVDANSKEERIARSRLSICMNIFEDLCGMVTLGSLEVDPQTLLDCS